MNAAPTRVAPKPADRPPGTMHSLLRPLTIHAGKADRHRAPASNHAALLWAACMIAIVAIGLSALRPPAPDSLRGHRSSSFAHATPIVPTSPLSRVNEHLPLGQMAPHAALNLNLAIPFVGLGTDRPAPLHVDTGSEGYRRGLDCLASALIYEAGNDRGGQAAVAQVILNRVRHPAFPHSICAVVYQGSDRTTGCQFTFTCDGALARMPPPAAWRQAQQTAAAFLAGEIDPAVGMATHYHTNWVHPYWSATLDKVAQVDTHLFFRWRGNWGRKAAFAAAYNGDEPYQRKLALLSPAHRSASEATAASLTTAGQAAEPAASEAALSQKPGEHFILLDIGGDGTELAMRGLGECVGQTYCKVVGWDRRSQSNGSPARPLIRTVAFLYVSDKRTGVEIVLWDCARFNRPSDTQCLSDRNRRWITFQGDLSHAS